MSTTCSLTKVDTNHLMWGKGIGNKEELGSLKIIFVARCNACFRSILSKTQTTYQTALQWLPFCFQAVNHIRNTVESKSLQMKGWIPYSFKLELKKHKAQNVVCYLFFLISIYSVFMHQKNMWMYFVSVFYLPLSYDYEDRLGTCVTQGTVSLLLSADKADSVSFSLPVVFWARTPLWRAIYSY